MMAIMLWPICNLIYKNNYSFTFTFTDTEIIVENVLIYSNNLPLLPFSKARTKAILRIGPHNLDILSIIICGLLGDF
jgi:hypothetical protein